MTLRSILNLIVVIGLINFAAFGIIASLIGGDAVSGTVEQGRYYLASHGRLTEVTEAVFHYSLAHAISVFVTHPLAIAAIGALQFLDWRERRTLHRSIDEMLQDMRRKNSPNSVIRVPSPDTARK